MKIFLGIINVLSVILPFLKDIYMACKTTNTAEEAKKERKEGVQDGTK